MTVVSLHGGPTGQPAPNDQCIEALETWLEMARAGEIVGVSMVSLRKDGSTGAALAGHVGGHAMIGTLEVVKSEIVDLNRAEFAEYDA